MTRSTAKRSKTDTGVKSYEGAYRNLAAQLDKAWREAVKTKTGGMSRGSHFRYLDSMPKFLHFCAAIFRLEKLANLKAKHLHAYVHFAARLGYLRRR